MVGVTTTWRTWRTDLGRLRATALNSHKSKPRIRSPSLLTLFAFFIVKAVCYLNTFNDHRATHINFILGRVQSLLDWGGFEPFRLVTVLCRHKQRVHLRMHRHTEQEHSSLLRLCVCVVHSREFSKIRSQQHYVKDHTVNVFLALWSHTTQPQAMCKQMDVCDSFQ